MTPAPPAPPRINRLGMNRFLWQALVRLYPPTALAVSATAHDCLRLLIDSTRPTTRKLHLRDLFADGRRYYLRQTEAGFRMTSDAAPSWGRRRQRSGITAFLVGTFAPLATDDAVTLVRLRPRMYRLAFVRALLLPTFFGWLVLSTDWAVAAKVLLVAVVYALSVVGHRLNAAIEINEMIFFVQKVLADLPPVIPRELAARNPDVVYSSGDFAAEWARFYSERQED